MMTHANRARRTALVMSVTMAALTFGTESFAQEATAAEEAEVIIVTGSRIPRPDLTSTSPVSVTTGAHIALDRSVTIEDFSVKLPQLAGGVKSTSVGSDA